MNARELADLCGDAQKDPYLSYEVVDLEAIKKDLDRDGYTIIKGLVPKSLVATIKEFWLGRFQKEHSGRVTWAPYLGQENHLGLSKDVFQSLFRACDFLWNEPLHKETREVALRMNALRNVITGVSPLRGTEFSPDRYGMFVTASFYPAGTGYMKPHDDGVAPGETLVHCLAPMTFRGTDYAEGGMTIIDRAGKFHDVEAMLSPGDVVVYDGALVHGVSPILGSSEHHTGRIQISPLPTILKDFRSNPRAINTVTYGEFFGAKLQALKNEIRIRFGMWPGLR